jgi:hypothetical protein
MVGFGLRPVLLQQRHSMHEILPSERPAVLPDSCERPAVLPDPCERPALLPGPCVRPAVLSYYGTPLLPFGRGGVGSLFWKAEASNALPAAGCGALLELPLLMSCSYCCPLPASHFAARGWDAWGMCTASAVLGEDVLPDRCWLGSFRRLSGSPPPELVHCLLPPSFGGKCVCGGGENI